MKLWLLILLMGASIGCTPAQRSWWFTKPDDEPVIAASSTDHVPIAKPTFTSDAEIAPPLEEEKTIPAADLTPRVEGEENSADASSGAPKLASVPLPADPDYSSKIGPAPNINPDHAVPFAVAVQGHNATTVRTQTTASTEEPARLKDDAMGEEVIVAGAAVQVNEKYLTADMILSRYHRPLSEVPTTGSELQFRQAVGEVVARGVIYEIQQALVAGEAEEFLEEAALQHVDAEMKKMEHRLLMEAGGSPERLRQKFIASGMQLEEALTIERRNLMVRLYLQTKLYPAVVINRRLLWNYYQKNTDLFAQPHQVQMQSIEAPFEAFLASAGETAPSEAEWDNARAAARRAMKIAQKELKSGTDFAATAKKHSRGVYAEQDGVMPGLFAKGTLVEDGVEAKLFELKEGAYSEIIEGKSGVYIVRAFKVQPGSVTRFEDAQETIEDQLRRQQFQKLREDYMKSVYEKATVTNTRPLVQLSIDQAVKEYYTPKH